MKVSSQEEKPRILDSCTGCSYCFLVCPQNAIYNDEEFGYLMLQSCTALIRSG